MNRPVPPGKLPNSILDPLLKSLESHDTSLVVSPEVGQDAAVVLPNADEYLVLKSDPITFATDKIGFYAVHINANDIATSGGFPRWFLATVLLPPGVGEQEINNIFRQIADSCRTLGITLCGGHTEITDSVHRPVISGALIGTVAKEALIRKEDMSAGDSIIMTKSAGFEGTSVIAREFSRRLLKNGMTEEKIKEARGFLDEISVIREARLAVASGGVSAMHDVTEGGIATALRELSTAGGNQLQVNIDSIPVHRRTTEICEICRLNPLGLIGSGSLLITARTDKTQSILKKLHSAGINATEIGSVLDEGTGVVAKDNAAATVLLPEFASDEITRLFA